MSLRSVRYLSTLHLTMIRQEVQNIRKKLHIETSGTAGPVAARSKA